MKKTTLIAALLDACFCPLIPVFTQVVIDIICSEIPLVINCKVFVTCKGWANMMWLWLHEGVSLQLLVPPD
jgi:uncharacterized membrane protein